MKKDVKPTGSRKRKLEKPISARQIGELARLLEERGVDFDVFQRTMIENPDGLCFFLQGKFGHLVNKEVVFHQNCQGYVAEVIGNKAAMGVALTISDYAMGRIFRVGDRVIAHRDCFYEEGFVPDQYVIVKSIRFRNDTPLLTVVKENCPKKEEHEIIFSAKNIKRTQ